MESKIHEYLLDIRNEGESGMNGFDRTNNGHILQLPSPDTIYIFLVVQNLVDKIEKNRGNIYYADSL